MANDDVVEAAAEANGAELPPNTSLNSPVSIADSLRYYDWAVAYEIKL